MDDPTDILSDEDMKDIDETVFSSEEEKIKYTEAYARFLEDFGPWELTGGYPPLLFKEWKEWRGQRWDSKTKTWEIE